MFEPLLIPKLLLHLQPATSCPYMMPPIAAFAPPPQTYTLASHALPLYAVCVHVVVRGCWFDDHLLLDTKSPHCMLCHNGESPPPDMHLSQDPPLLTLLPQTRTASTKAAFFPSCCCCNISGRNCILPAPWPHAVPHAGPLLSLCVYLLW
jgi:hypothetical protein